MLPIQLPVMNPSEFSRCDERIQPGNSGMDFSPLQRSDVSLSGAVERAIWNDDVLRAIEYYEIDVHAKNGIVHLNGHIANTASRKRIEKALRSVPGISGVQNHLILDENLTLEVAGTLGPLEHTYGCKFFTGSSHGVVSITGVVSDENVKLQAEMCVARNPNVRGVINHVNVLGSPEPDQQDLPFLQPIIGERIYFLDGLLGIVERVIINPNNRRVIAMLLLVNFTNPRLAFHSLTESKTHVPVQLVHVPMDTVRYLTKASGFLQITGNERTRYQDFDSACFVAPGIDWTPPYPYCPQDVLFPVTSRHADAQTADAIQQLPSEEPLESASFKKQFFTTKDLRSG